MDAFSKVVTICVLTVALFVVPIVIFTQQRDSTIQEYVSNATVEFVDNVLVQGKITQGMYEQFINDLDATGQLFNVKMEYSKKVINPAAGGTYTTGTESFYTTSIKDALYRPDGVTIDGEGDGVLQLVKGDYFSVIVKNRDDTSSDLVRRFVGIFGSRNAIEVTYGGEIRDENWGEYVDQIEEDDSYTGADLVSMIHAGWKNARQPITWVVYKNAGMQKPVLFANPLGSVSDPTDLIGQCENKYDVTGSKMMGDLGVYYDNVQYVTQNNANYLRGSSGWYFVNREWGYDSSVSVNSWGTTDNRRNYVIHAGDVYQTYWYELSHGAQSYRILVALEESYQLSEKPKYKITFNPNGGSCSEATRIVTRGDAVGTLPTPTRAGHSFVGWFTEASGGTQLNSSSTISRDVTWYAHWTTKKYTVTFNADGGNSSESSREVSYGGSLGTLPTATKTGCDFGGWYTAKNGGGTKLTTSTTFTSNATYYAKWTTKKYTVTFDADGGSTTSANMQIAHGGTIGTLPSATKTGYTFGGWYTEKNGGGTKLTTSTTITSSATYYAKWTASTCTVTFNANGGNCSESTRSVTKGESIGSLPTPTRSDYKFLGWYTAADGGTQVTTTTVINSDVIYYAHWELYYTSMRGYQVRGELDAEAGKTSDKVIIVAWGTTEAFFISFNSAGITKAQKFANGNEVTTVFGNKVFGSFGNDGNWSNEIQFPMANIGSSLKVADLITSDSYGYVTEFTSDNWRKYVCNTDSNVIFYVRTE